MSALLHVLQAGDQDIPAILVFRHDIIEIRLWCIKRRHAGVLTHGCWRQASLGEVQGGFSKFVYPHWASGP